MCQSARRYTSVICMPSIVREAVSVLPSNATTRTYVARMHVSAPDVGGGLITCQRRTVRRGRARTRFPLAARGMMCIGSLNLLMVKDCAPIPVYRRPRAATSRVYCERDGEILAGGGD